MMRGSFQVMLFGYHSFLSCIFVIRYSGSAQVFHSLEFVSPCNGHTIRVISSLKVRPSSSSLNRDPKVHRRHDVCVDGRQCIIAISKSRRNGQHDKQESRTSGVPLEWGNSSLRLWLVGAWVSHCSRSKTWCAAPRVRFPLVIVNVWWCFKDKERGKQPTSSRDR
ncbi:uncharacterized protein B0T23DRAFT_74270 [Neurospora hispaniola]|uniref:Uncharacterized protein n=1 Tax=Neurospora hispaniola TaxID=588809 RepID=A0AAJ0ICA4_9PEZI|nr:hypothetical protein B0T23DRAFT_74270 [Neurospora hispaniola]